MILCIDGNNFLRSLQTTKQGITDAQKKGFARQLAHYQKQKPSIQEILLVFDAGPFSHATREVFYGVVVMHAGQKSSADAWICSFVERNKGQMILVVTNDRALTNTLCSLGAQTTGCQEFYYFLRESVDDSIVLLKTMVGGNLIKYEHEEDEVVDRQQQHLVDALMEESSRRFTQKDENLYTSQARRSSGKKLSKIEKKTDKALKKL